MREELDEGGFAYRRRALDGGQVAILAALLPDTHAARNLLWDQPGLRAALQYLGLDDLATEALGEPATPINVLLLDKTPGANWKIPGHQDVIMPVERQVDEPGFDGWSTKQGVVHVELPVPVLEKMVALRIHLDDCPTANGALAVVPGSHRRGRLTDDDLDQVPREAFVPCEAAAGDVLLMRPLLVHRSSASQSPEHRRVLHVVYAADEPGKKVRWKPVAKVATPPPEPPVELVPPEEAVARPKKEPGPVGRFLLSVMLLAMMAGAVAGIIDTIQQMRSGRAGEIYVSMAGYRLSHAQVLVIMVVFLVALIGGALVAYWHDRHQRDFDRRYPLGPPKD